MKDIAIFGAGGMGRETACLIHRINNAADAPIWNLIGFYDDGIAIGEVNEFGAILGGIEELNRREEELSIVLAVGHPQTLARIRQRITNNHISYPNLIDPTVECWHPDTFSIGEGNIICPHCHFSCNVRLGNFNILNGDISLRHDVCLGDGNALMPGVKLSGGVCMGDRNFLGINAAVAQYLKVGNDNRIGAGAILLDDTQEDGGLYIGVPARMKSSHNT